MCPVDGGYIIGGTNRTDTRWKFRYVHGLAHTANIKPAKILSAANTGVLLHVCEI